MEQGARTRKGTNYNKNSFHFQIRHSPAPLNIPTPTLAPARPRWSRSLSGWSRSLQYIKLTNKSVHIGSIVRKDVTIIQFVSIRFQIDGYRIISLNRSIHSRSMVHGSWFKAKRGPRARGHRPPPTRAAAVQGLGPGHLSWP